MTSFTIRIWLPSLATSTTFSFGPIHITSSKSIWKENRQRTISTSQAPGIEEPLVACLQDRFSNTHPPYVQIDKLHQDSTYKQLQLHAVFWSKTCRTTCCPPTSVTWDWFRMESSWNYSMLIPHSTLNTKKHLHIQDMIIIWWWK